MTLIEVFVNQKRMNVHEHAKKIVPYDSFELQPRGRSTTGRRGVEGKEEEAT